MEIKKLDGLRGLACLAVVISHLSLVFFPQLHQSEVGNTPEYGILEYIHNSPFGFFFSGTAAVYCFFVLSGFVLSRSYEKKEVSVSGFANLIIKRYVRLAIPSTISCIVAFFIFSITVVNHSITEWGGNIGRVDLNIFRALYDGAVGPYINGISSYNWVLWTMKIEFTGSIGILLLCCIKKETKINTNIILLLSSIFISIMLLMTKSTAYLGYMCFVIGMALNSNEFSLNRLISFTILISGLYFAGVHDNSASYSIFNIVLHQRSYQLLNFMAGVLITTAVIKSDITNKLLSNKVTTFIGKLSFSIYLLHLSLIYIIAIPVFGVMERHQSFLFSAILASLSAFIITISASFVFHKFVDEFAIKASKKIKVFK